ncbi:hypothetical protein SDC9_73826 [bioreactor metagenome]|uniref:NAD-specific glutamate dehydrogenase n=1 Tax=bioreactor metagenome TaxID=1076179 RepID=A0A644YFN7_9ZZZZ
MFATGRAPGPAARPTQEARDEAGRRHRRATTWPGHDQGGHPLRGGRPGSCRGRRSLGGGLHRRLVLLRGLLLRRLLLGRSGALGLDDRLTLGLRLGVGRLGEGAVGLQVLDIDDVAVGVLHRGGTEDQREGLGAADLGHPVLGVVVLEHVLHLLLGGGAVGPGPGEQVLGQVGLLDLDVVVLGDPVQDQLGLDRVGGALGEIGTELLLGLLLLGVGQVLLEGHPGLGELLVDLVVAGLDLGGQQLLRQLHVDLLDDGLEHLVASGVGLVDAVQASEVVAQVLVHLLGGVELGHHLGEVVVDLGQLLLLHLDDGHLDIGLLAHGRATDEGGGEGLGVAGLHPGEGLVHALDHAAGADPVGHALGLATLDELAVLGGLQVEGDQVALGGRTVHLGVRGEPLAQDLDLLLELLTGRLDRVDLDLDGVERRDHEVGAHVHLGGELDGLTDLELGHLDLRLRQRHQLVLGDGGGVEIRERLVQGLLQGDARAEPLVDDGRRHVPRTEARDLHLLGDLLVGLVQVRLQIGEGHLDGDLGPRGAQLLNSARQDGYS